MVQSTMDEMRKRQLMQQMLAEKGDVRTFGPETALNPGEYESLGMVAPGLDMGKGNIPWDMINVAPEDIGRHKFPNPEDINDPQKNRLQYWKRREFLGS